MEIIAYEMKYIKDGAVKKMELLKHHFSQLFFFVVEIHPYLKKVYTSPLPPGIAALFFMLLPGAASFYS